MDLPRHLKFGVFTINKKIRLNESGIVGSRILYRRDIECSRILAQAFGATYQILPSNSLQISSRLPNGSWTGIMGMLQRGDIDLACTLIPLSEQISKTLDFSYPFHRSHLTFATRKLEFEPDPIVLLRPFAPEVWTSILISFLLIMGTFYWMSRKKYSFKKILLGIYATLLSQGSTIKPRNKSNSFLLMTWYIGTMFLGYSYCAVLLSFITFPSLTGVRTIPELAEAVSKGKYECTTYPGTNHIQIFASYSDSNFRIIGRSLEKNKGTWYIQDVLDSTKFSIKQAFIGGDSHILPYATKYFISKDEVFPAWQVVWMRNGFCCKNHLNRFVSVLWASGLNKKLLMDEIFIHSLSIHSGDFTESTTVRKLSLVDLKGAFVILAAGNILSTVVFLFEITYKKLIDNNSVYFIKRNIKKKQNVEKTTKRNLNANSRFKTPSYKTIKVKKHHS